jgi:hypothetical protein
MCHLETAKGHPIPHAHTSDDGHIVGSSDPKLICRPISLYRGDPKIVAEKMRRLSELELARWSPIDGHFQILGQHTPSYNCVGKVFGAKAMLIDISHLEKILEDDQYHRVDDNFRVGDIVVYRRGEAITHVGFVHEVSEAGDVLVVQSKWGVSADFLHDPHSVPPFYGEPEVWRTNLPDSQRTRRLTTSG